MVVLVVGKHVIKNISKITHIGTNRDGYVRIAEWN